ncbi:MAG: heme/hemin ABC transporter substrate-binding protein [Candidatus Binatia bacterium]
MTTHPTQRSRPARLSVLGALVLLAATPSFAADVAPRLVTLGGDITEIVFALGAGGGVVGADTSSVYPSDTSALPKVGYQRQLAAEGVLALNPTLILASDEAGPPAGIVQLRDAGVRIEVIEGPDTPAGAAAKIRRVADVLGRQADGERVVAAMDAALAQASAQIAATTSKPRVLFIYARGAGTLMVAGRATPADEMIRLAGGTNAIQDFDGFKPLTAEAVVAAAPDAVLMLARGVDSLGGADAVWTQPGMAQTPAGATRRLVVMDDLLLLGFGPRLGTAVGELVQQLHPELATAK